MYFGILINCFVHVLSYYILCRILSFCERNYIFYNIKKFDNANNWDFIYSNKEILDYNKALEVMKENYLDKDVKIDPIIFDVFSSFVLKK